MRIIKFLEKSLLYLFVSLLFSVLLSQTFLVRNDTREIFTQMDKYEGKAIKSIDNALVYGEIEFTLDTPRAGDKIKIMSNGSAAAVFNNATVRIPVLENSLIEIDATGYDGECNVTLNYLSDNIDDGCLAKTVKLNKNIAVVGKILFR